MEFHDAAITEAHTKYKRASKELQDLIPRLPVEGQPPPAPTHIPRIFLSQVFNVTSDDLGDVFATMRLIGVPATFDFKGQVMLLGAADAELSSTVLLSSGVTWRNGTLIFDRGPQLVCGWRGLSWSPSPCMGKSLWGSMVASL